MLHLRAVVTSQKEMTNHIRLAKAAGQRLKAYKSKLQWKETALATKLALTIPQRQLRCGTGSISAPERKKLKGKTKIERRKESRKEGERVPVISKKHPTAWKC